MHRRTFARLLTLGPAAAFSAGASSAEIGAQDATLGIRTALERGASAAVGLLGRPGGFLDDPKVRIPLPGFLEEAAKIARFTGQQARVDELVTAMNRAAEAAVPEARALLASAVRTMSFGDARRILTGGEQSVTEFFVAKTRTDLGKRFLPIVSRETAKVALARKYDAVAGKAASVGLVRGEDANLDGYVTRKALDGLYLMIGEEEKKIRADPVGTGSTVLARVFGSLR